MPPKRRKKTKKPNKVTKAILIKDHPEFKKIEQDKLKKKPLAKRRGLSNFKKDLRVFHPPQSLKWWSARNHTTCEERLEGGKLCGKYAPWYCQTCHRRICHEHSKLHYATKT